MANVKKEDGDRFDAMLQLSSYQIGLLANVMWRILREHGSAGLDMRVELRGAEAKYLIMDGIMYLDRKEAEVIERIIF